MFTIFVFLWLSFGRITYGGDQKELLIAVGGGTGILLVEWNPHHFWMVGQDRRERISVGIAWGVLAIYIFSTGWRVSGISNSGQTEMIGPARSMSQIDLIDKTISELSNWTAGSSTGIQISVVGLNSKALEWGLKDYPNSNYPSGASLSMNTHRSSLPPMDESFNFQDQYRGQDFVFESNFDWQSFEPMDWISWLVHRKDSTTDQLAIVFGREADLFPGGAVIPVQ